MGIIVFHMKQAASFLLPVSHAAHNNPWWIVPTYDTQSLAGGLWTFAKLT
jgi:hypothetical protein